MSINFFKGYATNDLHPREEINAAYTKVLAETNFNIYDNDKDNQHPLNYGTDPGSLEVRQEISKFLETKFDVGKIDPDYLNLTNGASFGIGVALNRATNVNYTKRVFIVTPCYYLINFAFVDAGFSGKISAINETPESKYQIDFESLESQLETSDTEESSEEKVFSDPLGRGDERWYKYVIYIVPTFSNPGGLTYSEETKMKLLELARKYNMLIICDDVYDLLRYEDDKPSPRLVHLDRQTLPDGDEYGHVVSNASTSKLISPGLRFGWHETATTKLAFQFSQEGCTKSGGTPSQLASYAVKELVSSGSIDKIIKKYIDNYGDRSRTMRESLKKYLPESTKFYGGEGGYFYWVVLDAKYDVVGMVDKLAKDHGIILALGTNFEVVEDQRDWSKCVRLCFSFLTSEQIEFGIRTWGTLFDQ